MSADLAHIDTWLFDLDDTLYPVGSDFALQAESRMTAFVEKTTGLPREAAYALQKQYLAEHGLTLKGLMLHHGVDPADFHAVFQDISLHTLAHDAELLEALARLPGRRLVFTNADAGHAARVMAHLGLTDLFDEVFDIAAFDYMPKPDPLAFEKIIAAHGVRPATTAFFEDRERNLEPAAALGMTTVLVGAHALESTAPFVQHRTEKLAPFLMSANLKRAS